MRLISYILMLHYLFLEVTRRITTLFFNNYLQLMVLLILNTFLCVYTKVKKGRDIG